ncbi:Citrate transporter [Roseimaritima multifibrata]|uniref:Citrate transporter n=1 Tax=Roseimaritima multifibrata TaxID=1930274 RepID=A0A517MFN5_9BACT|nr:SLC13 family permease [Roseimaritima multifibrata]QDS93692.1 Citrate transporter [Roseimaritima multifibrata]
MDWEAWFSIAIAVLLLAGLSFRIASTDLVAVTCLAILVVVSNLSGSNKLPTSTEAMAGFGNPALLTVGLLFAVVAGLEFTGGTQLATGWLLRRAKGLLDGQIRLLVPVAFLSGFLNNTPLVAALMPVVSDLSKRTGVSTSRFLLPLSYAAILGGMCTLFGTSTNLLVFKLYQAKGGTDLHFFSPGWVGVPATILGVLYILVFTKRLLPQRRSAVSTQDDPRQYTVEMTVTADGPLVSKSIEDAGLRHLPGLYLVEIQRRGEILPAVAPTEKLHANDLLILVGALDSVVDLRKIRGLVPATDQMRKLDAPAWQRQLVETVVSPRCPLVGKSIREGKFRTRYRAAVIAVARGDQRVPGKLGDVVLDAGDVLLLEAPQSFLREHRNSNDFFLVSQVIGGEILRPERAWLSLFILLGMVLCAATQVVDILTAALVAAITMVVTRCCTMGEARRSIDGSILVVIGAAIGIGLAMDTSGAAAEIAKSMLALANRNPFATLAILYLATMICTESITNNAAALLMFPIAWNASVGLGYDPTPYIVAIMIAASASFVTPFGYQTNLMVYGAGGYRVSDYIRFGMPLNLVVFATTMIVIPICWDIKAPLPPNVPPAVVAGDVQPANMDGDVGLLNP